MEEPLDVPTDRRRLGFPPAGHSPTFETRAGWPSSAVPLAQGPRLTVLHVPAKSAPFYTHDVDVPDVKYALKRTNRAAAAAMAEGEHRAGGRRLLDPPAAPDGWLEAVLQERSRQWQNALDRLLSFAPTAQVQVLNAAIAIPTSGLDHL